MVGEMAALMAEHWAVLKVVELADYLVVALVAMLVVYWVDLLVGHLESH